MVRFLPVFYPSIRLELVVFVVLVFEILVLVFDFLFALWDPLPPPDSLNVPHRTLLLPHHHILYFTFFPSSLILFSFRSSHFGFFSKFHPCSVLPQLFSPDGATVNPFLRTEL